MKQYEFVEVWDLIVDCGIATDNEVRLLCSINGHNIDTLNDIIYCRTGYRDMDQWIEFERGYYYDE